MINLETYLTDSGSSRPNMQTINTPFPENSMFRVRLHCVDSEFCPADCRDGCITEAKSGLRSLSLAIEICYGPHTGFGFYDQITLPEEFQKIELSEGQRKSCKMGARMLAQLLAGSGASLQVQNWKSFDNLETCVAVTINRYNGNEKQRLLKGLLPNDSNILQIQQKGEIIAEAKQQQQNTQSASGVAPWLQQTQQAPNAQQTAQMLQNTFGATPQITQNSQSAWLGQSQDDVIPF